MSRFSVIVPAYNASATLSQTLDSMLAQTFEAWECVVVDDGSTDDTATIAQLYSSRDPRFALVQQENRGAAGAYRTGIEKASADLLVICAADDLLLPRHLASMAALIDARPEYDIYSCNGQYLHDATGEFSTVYEAPQWQRERSLGLADLLDACFFSVGAVFRRGVFDVTGGHRPGVYVDDYDLWLRALVRGARHLYTPEVLAVHRVSGFQQSANMLRVLESNIEVYRNLLRDGRVPSELESAVHGAIARDEARILDERERLALEGQAERLRARVARVVGDRLTDPSLRLIHVFSGITRPWRRWVARRAPTSGSQGRQTAPRKVLIVASWYPSEAFPQHGIFVQHQAEALAARCDVAVVHVCIAGQDPAPVVVREGGLTVARVGLPLIEEPSARAEHLKMLWQLTFGYRRAVLGAYAALSRQWGAPDIVHVQAGFPAAIGGRAIARRQGVPYVVTEHQAEFLPESPGFGKQGGRLRPALVKHAMRRASVVIGVGSHLAESLFASGYSLSRPVVVPNIVRAADVEVLVTADLEDPPTIVHVSLMRSYEKNLPMLLDALCENHRQGRAFRFLFIGDGEDRAAIEAQAKALGLEETVHFLGRCDHDEVLRLLSRAAFSIISSRYETFSVAAAESIAVGCPVVSTRCGGPEDYINDQCGVLVPNDDARAMADAISWMLEHHHEYDREGIRRYACGLFSRDVVTAKILAVYELAFDRARSRRRRNV